MPFRETRKNTDAEKASEVGKQSKAEKKSETSDQRRAKYMPFLITTFTLGGARVIEAVSAAESNKVTEVAQPPYKSLAEGYVPSPQHMEQAKRWYEEKESNVPFYFDPPKETQATPSGETSQSAMETHQREQDKNKGTDHRSSNGEKIEALRSLMDNLKEDREALQSLKKMLNERRARSLLERGSAARTLLSESVSTCHDPCSDIPASVDCMKQCTTTVSSNPSACLDVSISDVLAKVEPVSGLQAPSQQVRLNYTLNVQNHCPQTIKDVTYHIQGTGGCPNPSAFIPAPDTGVYIQSFSADPSSVAPGDSAGVKAGQDTSIISRCETYGAGFRITSSSLPPELSVYISASGMDSTTNSMVTSQEKIFTVLGNSSWANGQCDLKCPPATDTPSIVFVHGFKPSPLKRSDDSGHDCNKYWGDAMDFLRERGLGDLRTIQYYNGNRNCKNGDETRYSSDLHHPRYKSLCTDYHPGSEGTNNESLYHLSCLFAQYLNYNFGRSGRDVILVGHSMGGIIMRETLFQMQEHAGQFPFPTEIGHVTDAITFNTPHSGPNSVPNYFGCVGCTQAADMSKTSDFMSELSESGRNPQTSAGFTHWTVIGSECDPAVSASSAIDMDASHAIVYAYDETHNTCYDHSAALHDTRVVQDAAQFYCDTTNPGNSPCGTDYKQVRSSTWRSRVNGLRGLSQLYSSVTGRLPSGAERVGSSHRLWLLSTAATAWALLRR